MAIKALSEVETATRAENSRAIDTIVLAFSSDPVVRWFYPDPHEYLLHAPEFFEIYGGKAFDHDTAYHVHDFTATAPWLPPGVSPDEDAMVGQMQNALSDERQEAIWSVFDQIEGYRPTEPYWYLPLIGVDPMHQRKGFGSVLMEHALRVCDREGVLAYLESSNPENISLYVRHGFKILGTIQEDDMPPLIPMLRKPQV